MNSRIRDLPKGEYHDGTPVSKNWYTERDASIDHNCEFKICDEIEFVSGKVENLKGLKDLLKEFKDIIQGKNKKRKLKNVLVFNKSCGAHIHFSFGRKLKGRRYKEYNMYKSTPEHFFGKAKQFFFGILERSGLRESLVKSVKKQYYRGYAENNTKEDHERNSEWNFRSQEHGRGMEWRSFNLRGVKTWAELFKLYGLAYRTLKFLEKNSRKWEDPEDVDEITPLKNNKKKWSRMVVGVGEESKTKTYKPEKYDRSTTWSAPNWGEDE